MTKQVGATSSEQRAVQRSPAVCRSCCSCLQKVLLAPKVLLALPASSLWSGEADAVSEEATKHSRLERGPFCPAHSLSPGGSKTGFEVPGFSCGGPPAQQAGMGIPLYYLRLEPNISLQSRKWDLPRLEGPPEEGVFVPVAEAVRRG